MEALKKAYAEVILNMAKEAAVRVMASEQKALQFNRDLETSKEEAVRMLLRLKLMIDTKTIEAESLSQKQQRRIDELEAQLNEAEGVIVDLRAELSNAKEELNDVKKKHLHHLRPHGKEDLVCRNSNISKSKLINSVSFKIPTELGSNACSSAGMSDLALCNYSKDNHILASEIVESNEPEIYQNGFCEIEISLADEILHSGDDPSFPVKVKHVAELSGRDVGAHIMPSSTASNVYKQRSYTFHGKKRRKTRYGKTKNGFCKGRCNKLIVSQRPLPAVSRSARYLRTSTSHDNPGIPSTNTEKKNVVKNCLTSGKLLPQNKDLAIAVARRSLRKRRVKYLDEGFIAPVSHCSLSKESMRTGQQCPSFSHSKSSAIDEDKELIDVLVKVEDGDDNSLLNGGMLRVESIVGDAKTYEESKELTLQGSNKTPINYTFSRKRKKYSLLNPNENSCSESSFKKRSAETENIDPRSQDSMLANDSSCKSKQLVQVARQLISLSGRSWWK